MIETTASGRPERLLVVEDDDFSQQVIQLYLKKSGFAAVKSALDGRQALDLIRAEKFDLILLDLNLPRLNGTEVLRRLAADGMLRGTPVIVITSLSNVEETKEALDLGAEDYLPKPFNTRLLQDRINACLEKRRLAALLSVEIDLRQHAEASAHRLQSAWSAGVATAFGADGPMSAAAAIIPAGAAGGGLVDLVSLPGGAFGIVAGRAAAGGIAGTLEAALLRGQVRDTFDHAESADASAVLAALPAEGAASLWLAIIDPRGNRLSSASAGGAAGFWLNAPIGTPLGEQTAPGQVIFAASAPVPVAESILRAALKADSALDPAALIGMARREIIRELPSFPADVALLALRFQ